jgi:hypothetical protein
MKGKYTIDMFLMLAAAVLLLSTGAAYTQGQVRYTKEMIVGKWLDAKFDQGYGDLSSNPKAVGEMTRFTFNADGSFEYLNYGRGVDFVQSKKVTGKFMVKDNVIHLLNIAEEDPTGDMFPQDWHIVADEINPKLDVLELQPDQCKCDWKRTIYFCRMVK